MSGGTIEFIPTSPEGARAFGEIKDGKFSIPPDRGPTPGSYKVVISSIQGTREIAPEAEPGPMQERPKEKIPPQYNRDTTLTATIKTGQTEALSFPLVSTPSG